MLDIQVMLLLLIHELYCEFGVIEHSECVLCDAVLNSGTTWQGCVEFMVGILGLIDAAFQGAHCAWGLCSS